MIPVRFDYFIETNYMHQQFTFSKDADERILITRQKTEYPIKTLSGKLIFYLDKKTGNPVPFHDNITMALRLSAMILLLMFVYYFAATASKDRGVWEGVAVLTTLLLLIRLMLYFFPGF